MSFYYEAIDGAKKVQVSACKIELSLKGKTRTEQLRGALRSLVQRKGDYAEAYRKPMELLIANIRTKEIWQLKSWHGSY